LVERTFSPEQAAHLYAETEGNPLFVVETVRAELLAVSDGTAHEIGQTAIAMPSVGAADLPPGVQAVVARRLSRVAPASRELLGVAAVIGRSFTFGVLARAAVADEDTLVRGLDELWQRRIVREHGPDSYDFAHDKLRMVAYAGLSASRRRVLHRRVAEALEVEHVVDLDAVTGQIAVHYERAGMSAQAATYYQRAATVARRLYANMEAIAHYRRALALRNGGPQHDHAGLYDQLGNVLHLVGQYEEARAAWQCALDAAPAHNPVICAHLYRKLGNAWRDQYRYDEALHAYAAAEGTLGSIAEDDAAAGLCWAQIQQDRITTHYWLGQTTEMLQLLDQIWPVVERHGSVIERARLHQISSSALLRRDRYRISPEAMAHARAYAAEIETAADTDALPAARFQLGGALLFAGDLTAAEREIRAALEWAERSGDISLEGRCLTYLTVIARQGGQLDLVRTYAERSLRVATVGQMPDYIGAAHGNLAWVAWRVGDYAAVHAHGHAALAAWRQLPAGYIFEWVGRWPLIGVALAEGDVVAVIMHARALLDERQQRPPPALEQTLEAAVHVANTSDQAAIHAHLDVVSKSAREQGYL
jgi:tetratricopeptide (TPR) repeat protein